MRKLNAKGWGVVMAVVVGLGGTGMGCSHEKVKEPNPSPCFEGHDCRSTASDDSDPNLWLEDIEGEKALEWVKAHNAISLKRFTEDKRYAGIEDDLKKIGLAEDRTPAISLRGGMVWNFWQDAVNVRGIWRRTPLAEYRKAKPEWETVLDIDALAKAENENWVYQGASCLPPEYKRCLVTLSRGGKDAAVVREFDVEKKEFVKDGFNVPEAKSVVSWKDENTVWLGTDFGKGSLTDSGYPRIVKLWRRGTPVGDARALFECKSFDFVATGYTDFHPEGKIDIVTRNPNMFEAEVFVVGKDEVPVHVPMPADARFFGSFQGRFFFQLRSELKAGEKTFARGALVSLPVADFEKAEPSLVLDAPRNGAISSVEMTRDHLYVNLLEDVQSRLYELKRGANGAWTKAAIAFPPKGTITVSSVNSFDNSMVVEFESFLVPTSQRLIVPGSKAETLRTLRSRFNEHGIVVEQWHTKSKDGTMIPYFIIHKAGIKLDGSNPTLLYAYGGFEISETPYYLGGTGKVWVEKGGVYVVANIRGGGEYGPAWHETVLKENRHKAFEDFFAISKDLVTRKVTSARRLGIMGGSNGGLLMGVALTQHPEYYRAVVSQLPLTDMLRYNKLLAGAVWMSEYGNPDEPAMREVLRSYSPYHNVRADKAYPLAFLSTTTKDDRVHPGHARKMAARLEAEGKQVLYYEHIQGGHGGGTNPVEHAQRSAREWTYLFQMLVD